MYMYESKEKKHFLYKNIKSFCTSCKLFQIKTIYNSSLLLYWYQLWTKQPDRSQGSIYPSLCACAAPPVGADAAVRCGWSRRREKKKQTQFHAAALYVITEATALFVIPHWATRCCDVSGSLFVPRAEEREANELARFSIVWQSTAVALRLTGYLPCEQGKNYLCVCLLFNRPYYF